MKLSISNIAWSIEQDIEMYTFLSEIGIRGLEIAPTRIIQDNPYGKKEEAKKWFDNIKENYGFAVSSIQSIWYGRNEKLFCDKKERDILTEYTKEAIDFAAVIDCKNLVFGCPRNRSFEGEYPEDTAICFFKQLGEYAHAKGTVLAMEANPVIYNTNFINTTKQAFELVKKVKSPGFLVNIDLGTILYNCESLKILEDNMEYVNHIHISEPELRIICKRNIHVELAELLEKKEYDKYISIEMKNTDDIQMVKDVVQYVKEIFR